MGKGSKIRFAEREDEKLINDFLSSRVYIHRHLDWRSPAEWLGFQPYLVQESPSKKIEAVLNCTPEPKDHFWIRLFACKKSINPVQTWQIVFPAAQKTAKSLSKNPKFISLAYQDWWRELLEIEGWQEIQRVIQLEWNPNSLERSPLSAHYCIRQLRRDGIGEIKQVDDAGFKSLWRQSTAAFKNAHALADYATVYLTGGQIIGFQICTLEGKKAHLARIAVLPKYQNIGVGKALVNDLITHYTNQGIFDISVNTQSDNEKSLAFYKRLGFEETEESFPIFFLD